MKQYMMIIFFSIVLSIYFLGNWYVFSRGMKALDGTAFRNVFKWCFWIVTSTFIIGQILERGNPGLVAQTITHIGSVWLAVFLYLFLFVFLVDFFRLLQYFFHLFPASLTSGVLSPKMLFIYGISIALLTTAAGYINARTPVVREVNLEIDKKKSSRSELKIVLVTDVHLGVLIGKNRAHRLLQQINAQQPDLVIFAGDLVDHNPMPVVKNNIGDCFSKIKAPLGVYAVTGNHEFIGEADISIGYFTDNGVQYIRDSIINIDNIVQIAGREDREKKQFTGIERKTADELLSAKQADLPLLLIDHQPVEYNKAIQYGVDLMMSGHTHRGQLWPFRYITSAVYENHHGLMKKGDTFFYTSSGYGTWGPPVRTGNRPEVVVFNIKFR